MISNTPAAHRVANTRTRRPGYRPAFTLVELMMVIGIAMVLIAILLPSINRAYVTATRNRMAFDLQAITVAIEAYRQDHGDIPRTSPNGNPPMTLGTDRITGAQILCRALLGVADANNPTGEGDGADGPGFRKVPLAVSESKIVPPYLSIDQFQIGNPDASPSDMTPPDRRARAVLIDREGLPILYYPGRPSANVAVAYATNGTSTIRPMFDLQDTPIPGKLNKTEKDDCVKLILGDNDRDGMIGTGETAQYKGPYLLISGGPDGTYGPPDRTKPISTKNSCDDLTNFPR